MQWLNDGHYKIIHTITGNALSIAVGFVGSFVQNMLLGIEAGVAVQTA